MSAATEDPLGSAAEEAARLVDALQGWFGARAEATTGEPPRTAPESSSPESSEAPGEHGPACRACPVCRGLAYVQQAHPDVVDHLASAAQHVAAALRALSTPPESQPNGRPPTRPASRAVRIDVEPDPHLPNCGPSEQEPEP